MFKELKTEITKNDEIVAAAAASQIGGRKLVMMSLYAPLPSK